MFIIKHSTRLDARATRLKLEAGVPYIESLPPCQYIEYIRPLEGSAGSWVAKWKPDAQLLLRKNLGKADDFQNADGTVYLTYSQALFKARRWFAQQTQRPLKAGSSESFNIGAYTVANALDEYFKDREVNGAKSIGNIRQSANAWIIPTLGSLLLIDLTKKRIKDWRDSIAESPRRIRTGLGKEQAYAAPPATSDERRARRDTANKILTVLKAALNYVYDVYDDLNSAVSPCWQKVKRFENTTKARTRFLSEEEKTKLINACQPDFRDLVRAALLTGCRYGELARLRCKDYSPLSETLTVPADISKSSKERHIVLDEKGLTLFGRLASQRTDPDDLIFTNSIRRTKRAANDGGWLASDQCQFMKRACRKAGLEPIRFHELRHTYASMLVNEGVALVYVAAQLGHSGISMVEKHYGHLAINDKAKAIKAAMSKRGIQIKT